MLRTRIPAISRLAHRRTLLDYLIALLKSRRDVSNTEMKRALTKNEYDSYRAELRSMQPSLRKLPSQFVAGIQRYVALLRKADNLHDRAENARHIRMVGLKYPRRTSLYQRAEHQYECAIEALNDLVFMYPGAAQFFDRPVVFKIDSEPSLDPDSMPRLHASRSPFALHMENGKQSPIFRLKLETLQTSLKELYGGAGEPVVCSVGAGEELDINLLPLGADPLDPALLNADFL